MKILTEMINGIIILYFITSITFRKIKYHTGRNAMINEIKMRILI